MRGGMRCRVVENIDLGDSGMLDGDHDLLISTRAAALHASTLVGVLPRAQAVLQDDDAVVTLSIRTNLLEYILAPDNSAGSDTCLLVVQGPKPASAVNASHKSEAAVLVPMLATTSHSWLFGEAEE